MRVCNFQDIFYHFEGSGCHLCGNPRCPRPQTEWMTSRWQVSWAGNKVKLSPEWSRCFKLLMNADLQVASLFTGQSPTRHHTDYSTLFTLHMAGSHWIAKTQWLSSSRVLTFLCQSFVELHEPHLTQGQEEAITTYQRFIEEKYANTQKTFWASLKIV